MASGDGGPLNGFLQIEITLPATPRSALRVEFTPEDFPLTWLQFFQKHHEPLFDLVKNKRSKYEYVVRDRRNGGRKLEWKLNDLIRDFINSFQRILQFFKATVVKRKRPKRKRKSTPATRTRAASPSPIIIVDISGSTENDAGPANDLETLPSPPISPQTVEGPGGTASNDNASVSPGAEQEPNMPCNLPSPTIHVADENGCVTLELADVSSLPTNVDIQVPQDAPDGTDMTEIKRKIIRNIENLDNATMIKMRKELQACVDSGKWLQLIRDLPMTAAALQLVLGVTLTSTSGE